MRSFLLLIFLLFVFVAAHASENVAVKCEGPVKAAVGENVTFLCFLQHPFKAVDISLVTWKLGSRAVYRYRSGKEDLINQAKEFVNKTSLSNFTINGNVSLTLTNVTKEHEGNYTCGVKVSKLYKEGHVNLSVDVTQEEVTKKPNDWREEKPGNDHTTIIIIVGGIAVIVAGIVIYRKCRNSKKRKSPESQTDPPSEEGHSKHLRKRLTSTSSTSSSSSSSSSQTSEQNSGTSHEQSNNLLPEDSCE